MEVGDFQIADISIERKTITDFAASLIDGRLFKQVLNLKYASKKRILLIEGTTVGNASSVATGYSEFSKLTEKSFKGALLKIAGGLQTPILRTRSTEDSAKTLLHLARQELIYKSKIYTCPQKVASCESSRFIEILSTIPNIGLSKSTILLEHFKTLRAVFTATKDDLKMVTGIGERQAKEIFKLATTEWNGR